MTTICAIQRNSKITFACDGATATGDEIIHTHPGQRKFVVHDDCILAIPGSPVFGLLLQDFLEARGTARLENERDIFRLVTSFHDYLRQEVNLQTNDQSGPFKSLGFDALIVNRGGVFSTYDQGEVVKHKAFYALGSGKDYALGALRALWDSSLNNTELCRTAIETAAYFDPFTNSEIEVVTL